MAHLIFENQTLETLEVGGRIYMLPIQIGRAAGLKDVEQVQQIYRRNQDEFDETMTRLVKIPSPSGAKETRVYSLRGAHMIGMKAQTEPAKRFRKWVLDVLEFGHAEVIAELRVQLRSVQHLLLSKKGRWYEIKHYHEMGYKAEKISRLLGKSLAVIEEQIHEMVRIGLILPIAGERDPLHGRHAQASTSSGPLFDAIHRA